MRWPILRGAPAALSGGGARLAAATLLALAVPMASCSKQAAEPGAQETQVPQDLQQSAANQARIAKSAQLGTPMAQRVATLGVLNKRNNLEQDIKLTPGESQRLGNVIVRLSACERTASWELPRETGAFVQVLVQDAGGKQQWRKVFSGWLFKESPSLNVVEHPIYDVWVKDCAMSFPGEEAPPSMPKAAPSAVPSPESSAPAIAPSNAQ